MSFRALSPDGGQVARVVYWLPFLCFVISDVASEIKWPFSMKRKKNGEMMDTI